MSVSLRLRRFGRHKTPLYRVVVVDSRRTGAGNRLEDLGSYNPHRDPAEFKIREERVKFWLGKGAVPSETVESLLKKTGLLKA